MTVVGEKWADCAVCRMGIAARALVAGEKVMWIGESVDLVRVRVC